MSADTFAPIRIELPFALDGNTVNVYLFLEPEPLLIDTGDASEQVWQALQDGLALHGVAVDDLARVVITHTHIDHFGNAARIADLSNARFEVLDVGYDWLVHFNALWAERQRYYREIFFPGAGIPQPLNDQLMVFYQQVADTYRGVPAHRVSTFNAGESISLGPAGWRVLHTPGHASMLTCFYQAESRQLLASDMLLQRTPTPVMETPPAGGQRIPALPLFIESLTQIEALSIDKVYPGHGDQFEDAAGLIRRQRQRIDRRKEQCYRFVAEGTETALHLMFRMYPGSKERPNLAGLWMLIGYLDILIAEGRVVVDDDAGVWHYRVTGP